MKKLLSILLITRILITPLLASKVIFIQDFQNNTDEKKYDHVGKSLADMVISDIVALGVDGVEVVERDRIKILLSELKLQESEYFDQATTQKMGKGLGANYALAGSFTVINGVMRIDARLINVTTSKIHSSFKTKGDEEAIFDLEADLVKNIGKGLEIDFGDVSRDKLSSPKDLDTLVKYADADSLMQKGDYKAATKALNEVRKSEPEFKLGKEAYKEAMRKLYAAKEKRKTTLSAIEDRKEVALQTLLDSALQKTASTKDPKVAAVYYAILTEIYARRLYLMVSPSKSHIEKGYSAEVWPLATQRHRGICNDFMNGRRFEVGPGGTLEGWGRKTCENIRVQNEKLDEFKENLSLYVEAYSSFIPMFDSTIKGAGPFAGAHISHIHQDFSVIDADDRGLLLMTQLPMPEWGSGAFSGLDALREDLIDFLFMGDAWIPAPCKIDKQYKKMGFELLELAGKNAGRSRRAIKFIEMHGDMLLLHGRVEDAIAKWQEILDTYPTYLNFVSIEDKIKEALK
ncbi:CsgG/HfaB family protein [Akkermansiaceae bacterium]|nr:CsgG/HfaB family protein [Akkermansiaceae bacterium]